MLRVRGLRHQPCIYCGSSHDPAPDHVPPKAIFAEPKPSDLIRVPCCRGCNEGFQPHDDYFAATLARRADVERDPAAQQLLARFQRGLVRQEAAGFKAMLDGSLDLVGGVAGQWVEGSRINTVVGRIARGLYWAETRKVLPKEYRVEALHVQNLGPFFDLFMKSLAGGGGAGTIGGDQFEFIWGQAIDDEFATAWLLTFFDRASFAAITASPSAA